jgi:hypothetical protein
LTFNRGVSTEKIADPISQNLNLYRRKKRDHMKGKERIIIALSIQQPDRVPLCIHGINEAGEMGNLGKTIQVFINLFCSAFLL